MDILIDKETKYNDNIKSIIVEYLKNNEISFSEIEPYDDGKICIKLECEYETYKNNRYYIPFTILLNNNDVYKVYPYEILYITIEGRKTVIYLINGTTIKAYKNISYFEKFLPKNCFGRPHNSFIVNLNYVKKVTNNFVYLKYKEKEYTTYTSQRKISAFKKLFLNFKNET